ncbi:MAG: uracil-DNA glycosylase [Deltaproteobacteria bacterium]|nr:MAG: uracil-DNA glycosylase [Deltaproteobacteria bacterium]
MTEAQRDAGLRAVAETLDRIDVDVYADAGRDPLAPILGAGDPAASVCIFGRDPGRDEVKHAMPFIGAGGQKVRDGLHRRLHGADCPDFAASVAVGDAVFWANTVPYKPIGNKVWSVKTRRACQPYVADLLVNHFAGDHVLTLGRVAFDWFGLADKATRDALKAFWEREDRFEASIEVEVGAADRRRTLTLHPLPHPSPLNATWYGRFPGLLDARLAALL